MSDPTFARHYAQLYAAANELAKRAENEINRTNDENDEPGGGDLVMLASIGKLDYERIGTDVVSLFNTGLEEDAYHSISQLLSSGQSWSLVTPWKIQYMYAMENLQDIMVLDDGVVSVESQNPVSTLLSYSDNQQTAPTVILNNYVAGIHMSRARPLLSAENLWGFQSVAVNVYKKFVHKSVSQQGVSTHFKLIHSWSGSNLKQTEQAMLCSPPKKSIQIQIAGIGRNTDRNTLNGICASLLLKIEDLMIYPEMLKTQTSNGIVRGIFNILESEK